MTTITTSTGDKLPHLAPIIQSQQPSLPRSSSSSSSSSSYVPRLYDLCKHVLRANVAHIVDVGDVPYDMISDVLHSCRVEQLREIEELSPHIAEEDEEIWEFFFKRDFPIVAEARAAKLASDKATTSSSKASQHEYQRSSAEAFSKTAAAPKSSTDVTHHRKILTNKAYHDNGFKPDDDDDDEEEDDDDHLFTSYRDLYYDEQVRREERLASAGERLKERLNHLAQVKSSRQTILDPRLSLNLRKRRKGQTLPTGRMLAAARGQYSSSRGQQQQQQQQPLYRTKSLAERARAKASMIAQHRPQPPQFTRSASMSVGLIPPRPKPLYKEDSLDSIGSGQPHIARKGIYGPRRAASVGPASIAAGTSSSATARQTQGTNGTTTTTFVERTVVVPVKSSIDKPYKSSKKLDRSPPGKTRVLALPSRDVDSATESSKHKAKDLSPSAPPVPVPLRNIPGITRRQQPVKRTSDSVGMVPSVEMPANKAPAPNCFSDDANPAYAWNNLSRIQISPPNTPATSSAGSPPATSAYSDTNSGPTSPPLMPSSTTNTLPPSLPMFSQPRRTTPSLFIPRKKPRTTK